MSLEQAGKDVKEQKKRWGKRRSNGALKRKDSRKAGEAGAGAGEEGDSSVAGEPAAKKMKVGLGGEGGLSGKSKVMGKKRSS